MGYTKWAWRNYFFKFDTDFLTGYFFSLNIRLVDFKLEFGRYWDNEEASIIVADEISQDNCRLWDVKTNKKLDKDRFRQI